MPKNDTPWRRRAAEHRGWFQGAGMAGLLAMMMFMSGCGGASTYNLGVQSSWDGQRITGTVQNNGPTRVACVLIEFALVNRQGTSLRTVSATKRDGLSPRDTWDFAINGAAASGATSTRRTKLQPC